MTAHLLAFSIGPVQDFIAAARRTRDLWFGSHVLSEISKAAAMEIQKVAGFEGLIFPAPESATDLQPTPDGELPQLIVSNVILAQLPDNAHPADVAKQAEEASRKLWREFAEKARKQVNDYVRPDIWDDQVDDVIEFYAAWVPVASPDQYWPARQRVMRLLAGRKACRDFRQPKLEEGRRRIFKSSFDGARETVLVKGTSGSARLSLADGEQLDVVGLTKRLAGGRKSYPSVARIAADPWLRRLAGSQEHTELFGQLRSECEKLADAEVLSRVRDPAFANFPYEGTAVYGTRHADIATEAGIPSGVLAELRQIVRYLTLPPSRGGLGEPKPYLAVLVADGDRIGAAISTIETAEAHREFSQRLSRFAGRARSVIQESRGVCVYAGGDDVLAFVPLDQCLATARRLHDEFDQILLGKEGGSPTLSVGIAIAHFMEPLEDLRAYGQQAEASAKRAEGGEAGDSRFGERNGLAVHVHPRGGVTFGIRERWQPDATSLDQRLERWTRLFRERRLPNKLPYDLRELARTYERWQAPETLPKALQADARRLLRRKQPRPEGADQAWVEKWLGAVGNAEGLMRLAAELFAAQWIASGNTQESGSGALQQSETAETTP